MKIRAVLLAAISAHLLAGCATQSAEPQALSLTYKSRDPITAMPEDAEPPCVWVADNRTRQSFYGYKISGDEATAWLVDGVEQQLGATAKEATDLPDKGMFISLTKAYVNPNATAISGVVVLRVVWGANDQTYRGNKTRTNWWGADSELQNILTAALDNALDKITLPIGLSTCDA